MKYTKPENKRKNTVYGVIGLIALFLMGAIFGFIINGSDRVNNSSMTRKQCDDLGEQIVFAAKNNRPDLLAQLNKVFSENCNNRRFFVNKNKTQSKPQPTAIVKAKLPETTCGAIEQLLKNELYDEDSMASGAHYDNARIYEKLAKRGCEKNRENYAKLAKREQEIADALNNDYEFQLDESENDLENKSTCEEIERVLTKQITCQGKYETCFDASDHIGNAKIYANLSERGCPENSEKYKELAKQELEIARALTDDDIEQDRRDTTAMVETYKRLQMQAEAAKMIEKAKKLTNPAIDFIIQLERIIEE